MSSKISIWLVLLMAFAGLSEAATCYSVYRNSNELVFQSRTSPVDLKNPSIGPEVEAKFPGGNLVFGERSEWCNEITPDGLVRAKAEEEARGKAAREAAKNEVPGIGVGRQVVVSPIDAASAQTCQIHVQNQTSIVLMNQKLNDDSPDLLKELQNKTRVKIVNSNLDGLTKKVTIAAINLWGQDLTKEKISAHLMGVCMSGSN